MSLFYRLLEQATSSVKDIQRSAGFASLALLLVAGCGPERNAGMRQSDATNTGAGIRDGSEPGRSKVPPFDIDKMLDLFEVNDEDYDRLFLGKSVPFKSGTHLATPGALEFMANHPEFSIRSGMSPVKPQGQCMRNTCATFTAVALLEYGTHERYSEQCLTFMADRMDSGHTSQRLSWAVRPKNAYANLFKNPQQKGLIFEDECPYKCREDERNAIRPEVLNG